MKSALLFGVGSAGDVFPFIALGKGLAARDWQVSLCANPTFKEQVIRAGLAFEPLGTREHYDRITRDPNLWHPRKGTRTILADFQAMDMIRTQRDLARQFAKKPGQRVVVASSLGFGARVAQEETGVPLVTMHLAPLVLRCPVNPPRVPGGWLPNTLLRFAPRMAYKLVDRIADPLIGGAVEPLRAETGLPPVRRYLKVGGIHPTGCCSVSPIGSAQCPAAPTRPAMSAFCNTTMTSPPRTWRLSGDSWNQARPPWWRLLAAPCGRPAGCWSGS